MLSLSPQPVIYYTIFRQVICRCFLTAAAFKLCLTILADFDHLQWELWGWGKKRGGGVQFTILQPQNSNWAVDAETVTISKTQVVLRFVQSFICWQTVTSRSFVFPWSNHRFESIIIRCHADKGMLSWFVISHDRPSLRSSVSSCLDYAMQTTHP